MIRQYPLPFDTDPTNKYYQIQSIIYNKVQYLIKYKWNTISQKYSAEITTADRKHIIFNELLTEHSTLHIARDSTTKQPLFTLYITDPSLGNLKGYIVREHL